ncbi:S8 family peptidase [Heyndrickxia sp. NPDC080065]|uniref:S8 family peptidase n=1 Tax=Heyndrickxia sp. NPDC080065 TaxID=3390568 RepID=UPI003CFC81C0
MKPIWKKLTALGLGITLVASTSLFSQNSYAISTSLGKQTLTNKKVSALQKQLDQSKGSAFSEDTFVIKHHPDFSVRSITGYGKDFDVIQNVSKLQYMAVKVRKKANLQKVMAAFQKNNKVLSINRSVMFKQLSTAGDPKVKDQYHLSLLKIAEAQKLAGKNKVTVAVIDTGVDKNHPELKGAFTKNSYNVLNPMSQTKPDIHGTHVTGIIASKKGNEIGGYGINPNVNILSIDVFDRIGIFTSDYTIAEGILYAIDHGAKVINISLGSWYRSLLLEEAVQKAIDKGVTIVAAAGNDGEDIPNYPAAYEGVISVGSVNKDKKLSYTSNFGPSIDLVAPGEDIYAPIYDLEKKSTFETLSGTSMASPMIAGVASLLLSKHPNLKPVQVEYILEHTATDLGEKGFDHKYGYGLVNPTAALKYDIKKLPTFVKNKWTKKEILQIAEKLSGANSYVKEGTLTKPFEQKWVQFHVEKGEYIQTQVAPSPLYDLKTMIHFYSDDESQSQILDVNDVGAGKTEGKLVKAPFSGTIAIGVKDVNGNYDDSSAKKSKYKLKISRQTEEPKDESTFESPINVPSLPYTSGSLALFGEKGDDDFFTFKTTDQQVVKLSINGIDGVDSAIQVYTKESLGLSSEKEEDGSVSTGEEPPAPPISIDNIEPDWQVNNGGIGEGETLTIPANPDTEYYVKVTNKPGFNDGFFFEDFGKQSSEPQSSLLPYHLKIEGKILPPDEDNFPILDEVENPVDYYQRILDGAIPYSVGESKSGYLQTVRDEDWYKINLKETGIYEFTLPEPKTGKPYFEIYRFVKDKDEKGNPIIWDEYVVDNGPVSFFSNDVSSKVYAGLKKGETYLIRVRGNFFTNSSVSMDQYTLGSKLIVKNPKGNDESNPSGKVKNLPASQVKGNFSIPGENDQFYLEGKKSTTYSLLFESYKPSKDALQKYPKDLFERIFGVAIIYEDVNKNRKLDDEDLERASFVANGLFDINQDVNYGSFKVEKGKNYIIELVGLTTSPYQLSLVPYKLTIAPAVTKDEDAGNVVKKNIPSKPLSLKKVNSKTWKATGHLNSGKPNGDEDWYVINVKETIDGYLSFDSGKEVDGVISLYKNGKHIATSNYYNSGQTEIMHVHLTKGKYHVKVRDVFGNPTIKPYTLTLTKK